MRIQDRIHRALNDEGEVNKILLSFGFEWFIFGVIVGAFLVSLIKYVT